MKSKPFFIAVLISFSTFVFAQQTVEIVQHNENKDGSVSQVAIYIGSPTSTYQCDMTRIAGTDVLLKNNGYINEDLKQPVEKLKTKGVSYTTSIEKPVTSPYLTAYALLFNDAKKAFKDKNYDKCIDFCDYMLSINRDSPEAYFLKGVACYSQDKKDISIKFLEIAVQKGCKDAQEVLAMIESKK